MWNKVTVIDLGRNERYGRTSLEVLYRLQVEYEDGDVEGKVSVAELADGTLLIVVSTSLSVVKRHDDMILKAKGEGQAEWAGGAFYRVNWPAKTIASVGGESQSLGPISEKAVPAVRLELQQLLDQFLQVR